MKKSLITIAFASAGLMACQTVSDKSNSNVKRVDHGGEVVDVSSFEASGCMGEEYCKYHKDSKTWVDTWGLNEELAIDATQAAYPNQETSLRGFVFLFRSIIVETNQVNTSHPGPAWGKVYSPWGTEDSQDAIINASIRCENITLLDGSVQGDPEQCFFTKHTAIVHSASTGYTPEIHFQGKRIKNGQKDDLVANHILSLLEGLDNGESYQRYSNISFSVARLGDAGKDEIYTIYRDYDEQSGIMMRCYAIGKDRDKHYCRLPVDRGSYSNYKENHSH